MMRAWCSVLEGAVTIAHRFIGGKRVSNAFSPVGTLEDNASSVLMGLWSFDFFFPESHQRSWWIVHTQPTKRAGHTPLPNPTNAVGGSFISGLQKVWHTPFGIPPNRVDGTTETAELAAAL